uniref:dolichyl-phosphate-mannose--protein mannosyltransferase n=1 Tax=Plectus sambesii TaxID=2011161 RepID=A0A914VJD2_9BILA
MNFAAPFFSPSDNPAAFDSSVVTRTLTFLYLPIFNLRLLTIPDQLSFDWSMDSIPLVRSIADSRAIISLIFYCTFAIVSRILLNQLLARGQSTEATDTPISARRSPSPKLDINANIRRRHPFEKDNRCVDYHCVSPKVCNEQKSAFSFDDTDVEAHCNSLDTFQEITLALSLLVLPFIPASNLVAYVGFVVAERVLYLPSVGFCILLTLAIRSCRNRWRRDRRAEKLLYFACCGVLFFMAARTWRRNCDWQSEESLYSSGIAINPAKAYSNLGNVLARKQKTAEAENAYRKALSFRSNMADTYYNLGSLLQERKRHAEAVDSYKLAISYRNNLAAAHLNLGLCQWTLGHLKEAEEIFIACAKLNGANLKDPKAHRNAQTSCEYNCGRLLAEQGRFSNAIEAYNSALGRLSVDDHYPSTASLYNMLGEAYAKLGRLEQAETFYRKALAEKHNHVPAHLTMGHLRLKQQQNEEALKWFETAVQLSPDDVLVHQHLGQFYQQTHAPERALDSFKTAHKLDETNFDILFALANAYRQLSKNEEAERCYQSLVELRPDASALASYGAILHLNKKYAEAETAYLKALTIKPDDKMTTENLQKLRRLMRR